MSNGAVPTPYISDAPIYDPFFEEDGNTITNSWKNWLNSISQGTGYLIVHDFLINGGVRATEVALLQVPSMTTAQRNSLDNARDGTIIYNTTTLRTNFRENGAWVTFTPIPA